MQDISNLCKIIIVKGFYDGVCVMGFFNLTSNFDLPLIILAAAFSLSVMSFSLKAVKSSESKHTKAENQEIQDEINRLIESFEKIKIKENDDVLTLMLRNVAEAKEYYILNKQQARKAFSGAQWACVIGFALFAAGMLVTLLVKDGQVLFYSTFSGAITEIIAGLFFWLYKQSQQQLNLYHDSLRNTEKFLTAIKLVEYANPQNRDSMYAFLIQSIFGKNGCAIRLKPELEAVEEVAEMIPGSE
ncbi:MAG: hypothetical protein H6Q72_4765 [Firmicutes bacterium]|nr:hypothetical protein [Bacillota bacterium]